MINIARDKVQKIVEKMDYFLPYVHRDNESFLTSHLSVLTALLIALVPVRIHQPAVPLFSLVPGSQTSISSAQSGARHWATSAHHTVQSLLRQYGISDNVIASIQRSMPRNVQKKWKTGMRVALDMHEGRLQNITLYAGVLQAWQGKPHATPSQWRFVRYVPSIERAYQRLAVRVGVNKLSTAILQQAPSPLLGRQILHACHHSGIAWGSLRNSTVHVMYQKLRNTETNEEGLGHVAMVRIENKGRPLRTYYAYAHAKQRRFAFYTLAGVCAQHSVVANADVWGHPVRSNRRCTSSFGMRIHPTLKCWKFHKGTDFGGSKGTPILATAGGIVRHASCLGTYGKRVEIQHGPVYRSLYAHLSHYAPGIQPGSHVRKGQVIGYMGNTGRTSGVHLHFEIKRHGRHVNPVTLLGQKNHNEQTQRFNALQLKQFKSYVALLHKRYVALGRIPHGSSHSKRRG